MAHHTQRVAGDHPEGGSHQRHHAVGHRRVGQVEEGQPAQRRNQPVLEMAEIRPHEKRQAVGQGRREGHLPGAIGRLDGDEQAQLVADDVDGAAAWNRRAHGGHGSREGREEGSAPRAAGHSICLAGRGQAPARTPHRQGPRDTRRACRDRPGGPADKRQGPSDLRRGPGERHPGPDVLAARGSRARPRDSRAGKFLASPVRPIDPACPPNTRPLSPKPSRAPHR